MKGQISIDYVAGALIFFGSLIFLVSNVMTALPAFTQGQQTDELTLSAWSISEVMMNDEGAWQDGGSGGRDWHNHVGDITVLGLRSGDELSRDKVEALTALNQSWIRGALRTEKKVNVDVRELVDIDTYRSFSRSAGDEPSFLTEPAYPVTVGDEVHYGATALAGEEKHVLLTKNTAFGWYNRLRVSDDWDFSDDAVRNLTSDEFIPIGDGTYVAEAGNTEISEGNLLILWRDLGRTGDVPRGSVDEIVSLDRYGVVDGNVVEVTFRVWQ